MHSAQSIENELQLLKLSVDRSFDEVFWLDFSGNILYVNDAACRITGYSRDELCSMTISDLDTEIRTGAWELTIAELRERKTRFITSRHQGKNGKFTDVEIVAVYVNKGDQEYSVAFVRDITERKRAENELRATCEKLTTAEQKLREQYDDLARSGEQIKESEEKFRKIIESSIDGFMLIDVNGNILEWNPALEKIFGIPASEALASNILDIQERLVVPEHRNLMSIKEQKSQFSASFPVLFTRATPLFLEVEIVNAAGHRRIIQQALFPIFISRGKRVGCIVRDVTEQRMADRKIRESEAKYRSILENIQDCYYRTDTEGNIILTSPSAAKIFGYSSEAELYGKNIADILYVNPEDRKKVLAEINSSGWISNYEILLKRKDGTPLTILASSHKYYDAAGTFLGIEGILRDISDRKQAEEATKRRSDRAVQYQRALVHLATTDTPTLKKAWNRITETGSEVLDVERVSIWFFTAKGEVLTCNDLFVRSEGVHSSGDELARSDYPRYFAALRENRAIVADEANTHDDTREFSSGYLHSLGIISMLDVPIRSGRELIGVLCFEHTGTFRSWDTEEQDTAAALADFTAIVLEQARGRQLQVDLRRSEEKYRVIFENTGTAALLVESDTTISLVNTEFERLSGYTKEEIENKKKWTEFIAQEDLDRMVAFNQQRQVDPEQAPRHYEFSLRTRSGEIRNMYLTIDIIPGTSKRFIASLLDLTELKKAERAIRESEEKYRAVVTLANDGIVIIQDGVYKFINPKAAELYGGAAEEFINKPFLENIHPREQKKVKDFYQKRMRGEQVRSVYETILVNKNREAVDIELNAVIIMFEGRPADLVHIRDITERKRSQKALEQAKKKLNLLNYVTFNDIQEMIFSLSAYQHLALSTVNETQSPIRTHLEKEADILQKIADSLKYAQTYQDLGLKTAKWQNVNHAFLMAISHLDILKIKHTVTTGKLEIFADPLLEQVFQILAENTLIHSKTGTEITIGYTPDPDGSLVISFEDNGAGIPDNLKNKIFLPEFQRKKAVGLFLAREILEITDISIIENGEPGKGARFEMTVPKGAFRFTDVM